MTSYTTSLINKIFTTASSRTAKNIYLVFLGNGFNAFLGFLTIIFVSRNLGPENFGVFSLVLAIFMGAAKLSDLGLNFAAARFVAKYREKEKEQGRYINVSLKYKIFLILIVSAVGLLSSNFLAINVFNNPLLIIPFKLSFLILPGLVLYDFYLALVQAREEFLKSIFVAAISSIFKLLAVVAIINYVTLTTLNSFAIYGIGPILGFLLAFLFIPKNYIFLNGNLEKERGEIINFSKWMGVSVLITSVSERLDIYMVSNMLGSYDTGIYSAGSRFAMLFSVLIGALGIVLMPKAASIIKIEDLKRYIKKVPILISGLIVLLIGAIIIAPWIFSITVGVEYAESVNIFRVLSASMIFIAATSPLSASFFSLDKPKYFTISSAIGIFLMFTLNLFLIRGFGAIGASLSSLITNAFLFIFTICYLKRSLSQQYS